MYPVQEPAILDDIFPTEQVRSERVYDVAYCQGVLADLLPGTVAGKDARDAMYSTLMHQQVKPLDSRRRRQLEDRRCEHFFAFILPVPPVNLELRDISLSLSGGDILAVLYVSEAEARAFLRVLSGRLPNHVRVTGDFFVNGHRLNPQQFASRTAHVTIEELPASLTVVQYLRISAALHPPVTKAFKVENMVSWT
ncbi:unnamed protein product [Heligmosomoides polygyrus]|uniref:Uncharacterized protein n=1 Tax=Heligmosomoides polygyrus TaxID=6339 RepID=A0A183GDA9_HELPZ|nr:unnamed protein product [Heligmosomoides polygyrus]